jgi:uncharacterized protein (TIGR03435 family)
MNKVSAAHVAVTFLTCLVGLASGGRLSGQVVVFQPSSPVPIAGSAVLPAPPAPIDPSAPLPSFEVASVKKLPKPLTSTTGRSGPGRMIYTNVPLRTLMMLAWGIRDYQIIDPPGWVTTDRFSINAKAETNAPRDQVLLMLRSLIVERFNLKYRAEKRELPTYVLVLPGKEWKPNSLMRPCVPRPVTVTPALAAAAAAAGITLPATAQVQAGAPAQPTPKPQANATSAAMPPPSQTSSQPKAPQSTAPQQANPPSQPTSNPQPGPPSQVAAKPAANPTPPGVPVCGSTLSSRNAGLNLTGTTATLASLLGSLGGLGLVQDRTGLTGTYQFVLDPSVIEGRLSAAMPMTGDSLLPNVSSAGGSISSAVQDLGLKLERRKEPVDVLVIESVSHPDED